MSRGWPGGWVPQDLVLLDGNLWGILRGTLHRAPLGGVPEAVFDFPTVRGSPLLVLAEPLQRGEVQLEPTVDLLPDGPRSEPGSVQPDRSAAAAGEVGARSPGPASTGDAPGRSVIVGGGLLAALVVGGSGLVLWRKRHNLAPAKPETTPT